VLALNDAVFAFLLLPRKGDVLFLPCTASNELSAAGPVTLVNIPEVGSFSTCEEAVSRTEGCAYIPSIVEEVYLREDKATVTVPDVRRTRSVAASWLTCKGRLAGDAEATKIMSEWIKRRLWSPI
jgi:DNA-binding transcriptional LysR family regulator